MMSEQQKPTKSTAEMQKFTVQFANGWTIDVPAANGMDAMEMADDINTRYKWDNGPAVSATHKHV